MDIIRNAFSLILPVISEQYPPTKRNALKEEYF